MGDYLNERIQTGPMPHQPAVPGKVVSERDAAVSATKGVSPVTNEKSDEGGAAYVFMGEHVHELQKAAARKTLLATLRPGEALLGSLSVEERRWLETALTNLIRIDRGRRAENVTGSAYCIFETDRGYFQCLAQPTRTSLLCESVSENWFPGIAAIVTPEKRDRLVREFAFTAPGSSGNFWRRIDIKGDDDLACVARLAFRVLRDVYGVKDFGAARFKWSLPKPAVPVSAAVALPGLFPPPPSAEKPYAVFVDDNFPVMNEGERYRSGDYATLAEAVAECKSIVDDFLNRRHRPGMSSNELFGQYTFFGEDPFIRGPADAGFSAWDYARQRCNELCRSQRDDMP